MTSEREPLNETQQDAVKASIGKRAKELEEAFMDVIIQSVPVFQCADAMKKSIDEILQAIESDQFERAAALGYDAFCSNFVWMQRTLGGMNDAAMQCSEAISGVAVDCGLAHEQVKPLVAEFFERIREPRGKTVSDDERKSELDEMLANFRHPQPPQ
jgi:hypothetical protein